MKSKLEMSLKERDEYAEKLFTQLYARKKVTDPVERKRQKELAIERLLEGPVRTINGVPLIRETNMIIDFHRPTPLPKLTPEEIIRYKHDSIKDPPTDFKKVVGAYLLLHI